MNCAFCQKELSLQAGQKITRTQECAHCSHDLRVCLMCSFYSPQAYNECTEPNAERIVEKEKANYCDYFVLGRSSQQDDAQKKALEAAKALFKN